MARLPQPGGDAGQWGQVLNDFLSQAHKTDGSLKDGIVQTANLAAGAVNNSTITNGSISEAKLDAAAQAKLNATGGGSVTLSGDVTGPSSATVVANGAITETKLAVALATKINNKADATHSHALDGLSDVSAAGAIDGQSLVFNGGSWGPGTVGTSGGSVVDATTTTKGVVQLAGDLAGSAAAPTVPGLAAKLDASQKGAANGVASLDATGKVPAAQLPAAGTTPDATTTTKGVVQLAGDLAGTAAAPTVPNLGNLASLTTTNKTNLVAAINEVKSGSSGTLATNEMRASLSFMNSWADSYAFLAPPAADVPTVVFTPNVSATTISGAVLTREKRISNNMTLGMDLAGDTHYRVKGVPLMDPEESGNSQATFVRAPFLNGTTLRLPYTIETEFCGTAIEFLFRSVPTSVSFMIKINGQWTSNSLNTYTINAGYPGLLKLTFSAAAARRIEIHCSDIAFGGAYTLAAAQPMRPLEKFQRTIAFVGDSFTAGTADSPYLTYARRVAHLLGADQVIYAGLGGSGWTTTSPPPFSGRMSQVLSMNPHIVVFQGSRNDSWGDIPALQSAVTSTVSLAASVPYVFVTGYWMANNGTGNDAVKAGTLAAGRQFVDLMGIIYGTGRVGATTGNGNADIYVDTDNVHPTQVAHTYIANRLWQALQGSFSVT